MHVQTHSVEQTIALGRLIGRFAPATPVVSCVALDGPLGAGKTHLARGIALGAHVSDPEIISSPTYVLMNIYEGAKQVYHLDAYRMESVAAFEELGFEDIIAGRTGGGIVVVEWAQRVAQAMPADTLWVAIEHDSQTMRTLTLRAAGEFSAALLDKVTAAVARGELET